MTKNKIHFMGLLANTDSSILKVGLDHGFKVECISDKEGARLISNLEDLPYRKTYEKLCIDFPCLDSSEKKFYFISNSFDSDIEINDEGILTNFPSDVTKFFNNYVCAYLDPVIRLMRLFREGYICMPLIYFYLIDNVTPKSILRNDTFLYVLPEPKYTLKNSEIPNLQKFIKNIKLPFKKSFLQLAFENFELSYQTHNINLSFLLLMISLETLLNPGDQELRYRVSRNAAVLLGKETDSSKLIFYEVKDLYDKRSKIVHTGKLNIINKEDLSKLSYYVRESIKEINRIGKNKKELLDILVSCGFGDRPWTK